MFADIDDGGFAGFHGPLVLGNEAHDLVQIQNGTVSLVAFEMISAHAYFSEVTRMVLVEIDGVVMLSTGITATTRMLSVFADTSMAVADVFNRKMW